MCASVDCSFGCHFALALCSSQLSLKFIMARQREAVVIERKRPSVGGGGGVGGQKAA